MYDPNSIALGKVFLINMLRARKENPQRLASRFKLELGIKTCFVLAAASMPGNFPPPFPELLKV